MKTRTTPVTARRSFAPALVILFLALTVGLARPAHATEGGPPGFSVWKEIHIELDSMRQRSGDKDVMTGDTGFADGWWSPTGTDQVTTTAPFDNDGDGTMVWAGLGGGAYKVRFHAVNGVIIGTVPNRASDRFTVTGGQTFWTPQIEATFDETIAPGQKGGPLKINVEEHNTSPFYSHEYKIFVDGWIQAKVDPPAAP